MNLAAPTMASRMNMTHQYSILFLVLASLFINGCARLTLATSDDVVAEVNRAREQQNFTKAWYYIEHIRSTHPQYDAVSALRDPVLNDINAFETAEIQRARQLAGAGRWHEAFEVLDAARARWQKSGKLDAAYVALEKREAVLFNRLRTELLLDEASWLHARLGTLEQLETLNRRDASDISGALQRRRAELVDTLTELGNAFAEQEDWVRTRDLLSAAQRLSGSDEVPAALATARKQVSLEVNRHRRAREEQVQSKAVSLLEAYDRSDSLADLLAARDFISNNNQNGQLDQYASRLEAICQQRYQLGIQEGDALYAEGRYEDAFQTWERITGIYPGDAELEKKMERARKVLSNLKALSDS